MYLDICRFWISAAELKENGKYSISKVMGPDEYHESYPGSAEGGLTDNSYTNVMVVWSFTKVQELC